MAQNGKIAAYSQSKALWASSWMNSGLLPLWQNKSLCQTICMKTHVTCTFILLKIRSFSCEMFCTSIRSKKRPRQKATPKWKLSLHLRQVAHQVGTYSGFCSITRSISTTINSQLMFEIPVLISLVIPPSWKSAPLVNCRKKYPSLVQYNNKGTIYRSVCK